MIEGGGDRPRNNDNSVTVNVMTKSMDMDWQFRRNGLPSHTYGTNTVQHSTYL